MTGSSVIVSGRITITFNYLIGIAHRPIAHTCDRCLELPSAYTSYLHFEQKFNAVLADDHNTHGKWTLFNWCKCYCYVGYCYVYTHKCL